MDPREDTFVGEMQFALSGIVTILVYGLIIGALYKLFQIHTVLSEVKELLTDIKRNTSGDTYAPAKPGAIPPQFADAYESPDELIRALSAEADEVRPLPASQPQN
jgi:hypothetical protein